MTTLLLFAIAALVLVNGFFVACEFALVSVRRGQVRGGSLAARLARRQQDKPAHRRVTHALCRRDGHQGRRRRREAHLPPDRRYKGSRRRGRPREQGAPSSSATTSGSPSTACRLPSRPSSARAPRPRVDRPALNADTIDERTADAGITLLGQNVKAILSFTAAVNLPRIGALGNARVTVTATGVRLGDRLVFHPNDNGPDSPDNALIIGVPFISADDEITIPVYNPTERAINPSNRTWHGMVWRFG